jgi:small conductance mechanosensitive channel
MQTSSTAHSSAPHLALANVSATQIVPFIVSSAIHIAAAGAILIAGFWFSGKADALVGKMLSNSSHVDDMLKGFFGSIARYFMLTVTMLAVLSQFGVQTTSLVAVIGAASLAIGLALQGTLANLAAGVMLLIFRPFRIGHQVVVAGNTGTVKQLSLFWTEVVTGDNVQVMIPNGSVWGQPLKNLSTYSGPPATAETRFPVPETADVSAAMGRIRELVTGNPNVLETPAPSVLLDRGGADNGLQIVVGFAPAGGGDHAASVKSEIIRAVHDDGQARADMRLRTPAGN